MFNFILVLALMNTGPDGSSDGSRSLSSSGMLGGADVAGTQVKGSKMLYTTGAIAEGSVTAFLIRNIIALEKTVEGVGENNDAEMKKRDPQLRKIISSILDLEALGKAALITYWESIDKTSGGKKQLDRYLKLFRNLVEENYLEKIRVYIGGKYKISFTSELQSKKGILSQAKIKKKDADLIVEFLGRKTGAEWQIVDTRLDETSLEETYRGSFNRIIKKHGGIQKGFPELLKVMEKRLAELRGGKATKL